MPATFVFEDLPRGCVTQANKKIEGKKDNPYMKTKVIPEKMN